MRIAQSDMVRKSFFSLYIDIKGVCHEIFDRHFFSWFQPI